MEGRCYASFKGRQMKPALRTYTEDKIKKFTRVKEEEYEIDEISILEKIHKGLGKVVSYTGQTYLVKNLTTGLIVTGVVLFLALTIFPLSMRFCCPNLWIWACTKYNDKQILKLKRSSEKKSIKKTNSENPKFDETEHLDPENTSMPPPMYLEMEGYKSSPSIASYNPSRYNVRLAENERCKTEIYQEIQEMETT